MYIHVIDMYCNRTLHYLYIKMTYMLICVFYNHDLVFCVILSKTSLEKYGTHSCVYVDSMTQILLEKLHNITSTQLLKYDFC